MTTRRRLALRFVALLVAASAAMRISAPALDAFLHHRAGTVETSSIHLDKPGGCGSHAERCAVRVQTFGLRFTAVRASASVLSLQVGRERPAAPTTPPARRFSTLNHSRAPPVTSV